MSGPNPLGVPERRVDPAFLGRLVSGSFPFEALGSGRLARGAGLGPKVPTMPSFPAGEEDHPQLGKRIRLTVISWGTVYY